jgi:uncharacterized protein YbcI
MVRIHREYYGKGPTKTKTFVFDDMILCVLKGGATRLDRSLADAGRADMVVEMRQAFQASVREHMRTVVEEITGRAVDIFMSQSHVDPDVSIEFFMLAPPRDEGTAA